MDIIEIVIDKVIESAISPVMTYIGKKLKSFFQDRKNIFEYLQNKLNKDLKNKKIVEPERNILIPSVEGILLNEKDTPLHEMFYNLLKSSMDKETKDFVHPAFPQILKQMSPQEAKFLLDIYNDKISRNYNARGDKDFIYQLDFDTRGTRSIITYKEKDSNDDYSYIYNRLHYFNLTLIKEVKKNTIIGNPPDSKITIKDKVMLSEFGKNFMDVCYNDECKKLLEDIDLIEYFKNCIKK